jgi:hypothetical protein
MRALYLKTCDDRYGFFEDFPLIFTITFMVFPYITNIMVCSIIYLIFVPEKQKIKRNHYKWLFARKGDKKC